MNNKRKICNGQCGISTGICNRRTFGQGTLDEFGYWEHPCYECARAWEKSQNKRDNCQTWLAWPTMTSKDFFNLCSNTNVFSIFLAKTGCQLLLENETDYWACVGYAIMAKQGLVKHKDIVLNPELQEFIYLIERAYRKAGWWITPFPDDVL